MLMRQVASGLVLRVYSRVLLPPEMNVVSEAASQTWFALASELLTCEPHVLCRGFLQCHLTEFEGLLLVRRCCRHHGLI